MLKIYKLKKYILNLKALKIYNYTPDLKSKNTKMIRK